MNKKTILSITCFLLSIVFVQANARPGRCKELAISLSSKPGHHCTLIGSPETQSKVIGNTPLKAITRLSSEPVIILMKPMSWTGYYEQPRIVYAITNHWSYTCDGNNTDVIQLTLGQDISLPNPYKVTGSKQHASAIPADRAIFIKTPARCNKGHHRGRIDVVVG